MKSLAQLRSVPLDPRQRPSARGPLWWQDALVVSQTASCRHPFSVVQLLSRVSMSQAPDCRGVAQPAWRPGGRSFVRCWQPQWPERRLIRRRHLVRTFRQPPLSSFGSPSASQWWSSSVRRLRGWSAAAGSGWRPAVHQRCGLGTGTAIGSAAGSAARSPSATRLCGAVGSRFKPSQRPRRSRPTRGSASGRPRP